MSGSAKSARRSRKRRSVNKVPRAVPSARRERVGAAAGSASGSAPSRRGASSMAAYGERPPGPFGGLPVSEIAILAGVVAVVLGWTQKAFAALITGVVVCFLGVLEVTAREHFSGYRSHATLLAAMAAVAAEAVVALAVAHSGLVLLIVVIPVFAAAFIPLRRRFSVARQSRVRALPPA